MNTGSKAEDLKLLSELGVRPDILSQYQILCLPENIENRAETSDLLDSEESIILSKLLKEEGVKCANSYDLSLSAKIIERRGLDLWLGSIWVLEHGVLPVLIGVLIRLLGDKLQKKSDASKQLEKYEELIELTTTKVHANLKIIDGKVSVEVDFQGDPDTFIKVLKGISNDECNSEE